jgi:hypothetical protein
MSSKLILRKQVILEQLDMWIRMMKDKPEYAAVVRHMLRTRVALEALMKK